MISIALGMDPNHRYIVQDKMSTMMAIRIAQRCKDNSSIPFATANEVISQGWLEQLSENGESEIEIFGAYEEMCVMSTVRHATNMGLNVRVPKKHIVRSNQKAPGLIKSLKEMNEHKIDVVPFRYSLDADNYIIRPSNELPKSYLS